MTFKIDRVDVEDEKISLIVEYIDEDREIS